MALGESDVDGMLRRMSSSLFTEWMAYDRLDPIGQQRGDVQAAIVATAADNAGRNVVASLSGKRIKAAKVGSYLPEWSKATHKQQKTPSQIYQTFKDGLRLGGFLR